MSVTAFYKGSFLIMCSTTEKSQRRHRDTRMNVGTMFQLLDLLLSDKRLCLLSASSVHDYVHRPLIGLRRKEHRGSLFSNV